MEKKVLLIDNYDSFTYNLVHAFEEILGHSITVVKNDAITLEEVGKFDYIVLSPGPGIPDEAGITKSVIAEYGSTKCILGVCLGLQSIAEVYGAKIKNLPTVFHGVQTAIQLTQHSSPLFKGIETGFDAGRYHSWAIDEATMVDDLVITGIDASGEIMSIDHKKHKVYAVQYHPESILTEVGNQILENFLNIEI